MCVFILLLGSPFWLQIVRPELLLPLILYKLLLQVGVGGGGGVLLSPFIFYNQ